MSLTGNVYHVAPEIQRLLAKHRNTEAVTAKVRQEPPEVIHVGEEMLELYEVIHSQGLAPSKTPFPSQKHVTLLILHAGQHLYVPGEPIPRINFVLLPGQDLHAGIPNTLCATGSTLLLTQKAFDFLQDKLELVCNGQLRYCQTSSWRAVLHEALTEAYRKTTWQETIAYLKGNTLKMALRQLKSLRDEYEITDENEGLNPDEPLLEIVRRQTEQKERPRWKDPEASQLTTLQRLLSKRIQLQNLPLSAQHETRFRDRIQGLKQRIRELRIEPSFHPLFAQIQTVFPAGKKFLLTEVNGLFTLTAAKGEYLEEEMTPKQIQEDFYALTRFLQFEVAYWYQAESAIIPKLLVDPVLAKLEAGPDDQLLRRYLNSLGSDVLRNDYDLGAITSKLPWNKGQKHLFQFLFHQVSSLLSGPNPSHMAKLLPRFTPPITCREALQLPDTETHSIRQDLLQQAAQIVIQASARIEHRWEPLDFLLRVVQMPEFLNLAQV